MKKYLLLAAMALAMLSCGGDDKKKEPETNWDALETLPDDFTMKVSLVYKLYTVQGVTREDSVFVFTPCNDTLDYLLMYAPTSELEAIHYTNIIDYAKRMVEIWVSAGEAEKLPIYHGVRQLPFSYLDQEGEWQFTWVGMSKLSHRTYGEWERMKHVIK